MQDSIFFKYDYVSAVSMILMHFWTHSQTHWLTYLRELWATMTERHWMNSGLSQRQRYMVIWWLFYVEKLDELWSDVVEESLMLMLN